MNRNHFLPLGKNYFCRYKYILVCLFLLAFTVKGQAQRTFASSQNTGSTGVLCLGCSVTNAANADDLNLETYSTLNVTVGLAATTYQELIFPSAVAANTPVTVKLGSGDNLLSLTALGAISIQAYNGTTAVGPPTAASSLISVLSNNNQYELTITTGSAYDRVRVTLNGGIVGALSSLYLYEAFYNLGATCGGPYDELNGISSGLLGLGVNVGGVVNPQYAIDGDITTYAVLNAGAGVVGAYAQETAIFPGPSQLGDSVRLVLSVPQSLITAGVLSNASIATFNGNTSNNDTHYLNSSLLNVQLLNTLTIGSTTMRKVVVSYAPTSVFDRVQLSLGGGIASVLTTLNFYEAQKVIPRPVTSINSIQTNTATICAGNSAALAVATSANTQYNWYTQATGGVPVATGSTFTTPALNATTTYYVSANHTGCTDQSARAAVTINVYPLPAAPVVPSNTTTICSGNTATFTANSVSGITYNWYISATGGSPVFTGNPFTTPVLNATTFYYAEAVNGSCTSATRTQVTATVNQTPASPTIAQTPVQICSGSSAVLTASSAPGTIISWYSSPSGGTPLASGTQFTTPALTSNTSYYAEASSGSCVSTTRAEADVIVNPVPATPTFTVSPASAQINSGQTATITASDVTPGTSFNWYTSATGGTPIYSGATFTTPALTSTTSYYIQGVSAGGGCTSAQRAVAVITVNPVFSTSCDWTLTQSNSANGLCAGCSVSNPSGAIDADTTSSSTLNMSIAALGASVNQTLIFSDTGSAGDTVALKLGIPSSLVFANVLGGIQIQSFNGVTANSDLTTLSGSAVSVRLLSGSNIALVKFVPNGTFDKVQITLNGGIVSALSSLDIYYATKQVSAPALTANTVNICSGSIATFTVNNPFADVTYKWYTSAVGGAPVFTGTSFTTPALSATTAYYIESSRTSNGCVNPNRVAVTANVTSSPVLPALYQNSITICSGDNAQFTVTNEGSSIVNWYDAPTGGTLLFTGAALSVSPTVTTNYYAELVNGTCVSPGRAQATVTVNPRPNAFTLQNSNLSICSGNAATLQINSPQAGVDYNWYTAPTGGTVAFTGNTFTTPVLTASTVYYAEGVNSTTGCSNTSGRVTATVTVNPLPTAPAVTDQAGSPTPLICSGSVTQLTASSTTTGVIFNWYNAPTGGILLATGANYTTPVLTATTTYYVEAVTASGCTNTGGRTAVTITVNPLPTAPTVTDQAGSSSPSVCFGGTAQLTASSTTSGVTFNWYNAATGGTLLGTGATYITPALTATTTYYVEAVSASGCTEADGRAVVTVTANSLPVAPTVTDQAGSSSPSICSGSVTQLTATSSTPNVTFNWYDSASGGTLLATGAKYATPVLTATTTYYVDATSLSGCTNSGGRAVVTITVNPQPSAPVIANGSTVNSCSGSAVTLNIANPQAGYTYNWYTPAGGPAVSSGSSIILTNLSGNISYYAEAVNGTGCISASRAKIDILVNPLPMAPQIKDQAGSSTPSICSGNIAQLTATSTTSGVTFNWYDAATGGALLFTGATFNTPVLTANKTYYVESVNAAGCVSATRSAVVVTIVAAPSTPQLANASVSICPGANAILTATSDPNTTINWYLIPNGGSPIFTGQTFTTPVLTSNTTYYVGAINDTTGCASGSRAVASVNMQRPLSAPAVTVGSTSASSITFTWQAVTGAVDYEISLDNGQTFITPSSGATGLTHTVNNLQPGQSISLIVRAIGKTACELSTNSSVATGTTDNPFADKLYIPNTFTPNGDGKNDVFMIYGTTIQKANLSVYNQWGELIFRTTDKSAGWDGTYKGRDQPVGVYVYYVEATMNDGHSITKKGTITLLR